MPAVLLEGGVIVNREDEVRIATPAYQSMIATAVVRSVIKFCRVPASSAVAPDSSRAISFRVVGVVSNDVLNIRSGPDAATVIVDGIPPNGKGIRMVGDCAGQWCPVQYLNARGWVNRRYLASE
jgi:SH3-like domain-containing protein